MVLSFPPTFRSLSSDDYSGQCEVVRVCHISVLRDIAAVPVPSLHAPPACDPCSGAHTKAMGEVSVSRQEIFAECRIRKLRF